MKTINLRDYYYWYRTDVFVEVTEEVAAYLLSGRSYEVNHWRRLKRNKANYSLDTGDGIEHEICEHEPSPDVVLDLMEQYRRLCCALNHLPETQGRRIDAHYLLNRSLLEIACEEDVDESSVRESIRRGLKRMRKFF